MAPSLEHAKMIGMAKKFEKAAADSGWPSHLESGRNKLNNAQAMRWTRVNAFDFLTLRLLWGPLWEVLCLRPDLSLSPFTAVDLIRFESIRRQGYTGVSGFFWHDEIICIYNVNAYLLVVSMCSLPFFTHDDVLEHHLELPWSRKVTQRCFQNLYWLYCGSQHLLCHVGWIWYSNRM